MWKEIVRKLSSRKLWLALAGVVTGIAMALGVDTSEVSTIAGALTAVISVVTYIVTEGKVDAESVKNSIIDIQDAFDVITGEDDEQ